MTSEKTPYRPGLRPTDQRFHVNNPHYQKLPEPEKAKPKKLAITERPEYEAACARCGGTFTARTDARGLHSTITCERCLAQSRAIALAAMDRWKENNLQRRDAGPKKIRCLRCGWSDRIKTHYPKNGWVCGADPRHPVIAE